MAPMVKKSVNVRTARILAALFLVFGVFLGLFDAPKVLAKIAERWAPVKPFLEKATLVLPYRFGLDIQGGTHLVYQADLSRISTSEFGDAMSGVRDVIERRVNLFGVAEPLVQIERSAGDWRLIVELAGVHDINAAIRLIGETPFLEFKEEMPAEKSTQILTAALGDKMKGVTAEQFCQESQAVLFFLQQFGTDPCFLPSGLGGSHVRRADVAFDQTTIQPQVSLELTDEGAKLFEEVTKRNIGKRLAIYLDGAPISTPVVREEITGGKAQITGNFTPEGAKELAGRLNAGALPVPIKLIVQQSVGASLGEESLARSFWAGVIGFLAVAVFMILWYRLPGLLSVFALLLYVAILLGIFKLIPVTLTVAGVAGFILSIGMAVDANILIFERLKEELRQGKTLEDAVREGFSRAWTSIRDSNVSSLITSAILYWFGSSVIKGFALTLALGILVSMFSAISVTRTLLLSSMGRRLSKHRFLFLSGFFR